jgi:ABC-2 type transport system permease protein
MKPKNISIMRLIAVMSKEFIQMKRDRATLAMMMLLPLMQVIIFGYAINSDPKHLPTAVLASDNSQITRSFIQGMSNSGYFKIQQRVNSEEEAQELLAKGKVQFIINIPANFTRDLIHQNKPNVLLEADGTDPQAIGNAVAALNKLQQLVFRYDFVGPLQYLQPQAQSFNVLLQAKYNPAGVTQYNIVTGLLGVVLTMTMIITTAIAITRERDRGTLEGLLSTPLHPLEIMLGKILPYIIVGYVQISIIVFIAKLLFGVPIAGNILLLFLLSFPFIAANLAVGITISTIAKNPLQAVQMAVFVFLPSILLSGFMFPFRGMPYWAQVVGNLLPLTHYLLIARGILIKGSGFLQVWPQVIAILIFLMVVIMIGLKRFRRTLD